MKILLTNDDGHCSTGLMLLTRALSVAGHEVYVVAPNGQRSASSHGVNLYRNMAIVQLKEYCGAKRAYTCSGTPADCVKFAVHEFGYDFFDVLISGPNNGENDGFAVLYSGTVAAAEEGVLCGIKSIALSRLGRNTAFYSAAEYLVQNLQKLMDNCSKFVFLNVNVPNLPLRQTKGVKICPLCIERMFMDRFVKLDEETYRVEGDPLYIDDRISDVYYLKNGYVTITPITLLRTDSAAMKKLAELER